MPLGALKKNPPPPKLQAQFLKTYLTLNVLDDSGVSLHLLGEVSLKRSAKPKLGLYRGFP